MTNQNIFLTRHFIHVILIHMKLWKPTNTIETILCLFAVIIIPITSIILGFQESILYENLTYIGNQPQHRLLFQIWGILVSTDYLLSFYYLTRKTKICSIRLILFAFLLTTSSISSFFIPYNPSIYPFLSNLHVYTSLLSSVFTIFFIIYYISLFQLIHPIYFHKCFQFIIFFITISVTLLFVLGDISGLLELIMSIFLSIFLYYMIRAYDIHKTSTQ